MDRPKAESLGLIVAELAINSLKHAFVDVAKGGLIVVTFDAVETEWTLSLSDNGGASRSTRLSRRADSVPASSRPLPVS